MKQKILSLFFLTAILLSFALVSAANFSISTSTPADLTESRNQTSFLITPAIPTGQSIDIMVTLPQQISDGKGNVVTLNPPYTFNFNNVLNGQTQGPVTVLYTSGTVPNTFLVGKFSANVNITATDTTNSSNTLTQTVPINFVSDFCTFGENGTDLSISRVDINNANGDDSEWDPLDEIIVKVEVSNDGNERVKSVNVELGLFDSQGKNVVKDLEDLNDKKIDLGSITDGNEKTAEFKFTVPVDFKEENYKLVVKAYSDDAGQKNLCTAHSSDLDNDFYQAISGQRETEEEKHIIVANLVLSPETAQCGDKVQLSGEVVNIGDTDYEDQVKVTLFNKELGINKEEVIMENFDQGDSSSLTFEFDIPGTAAEKTYTLELRTYYDYDGEGGYDITSDKKFIKTIKVEGNCQATPTPASRAPSINAILDPETPEAIAGKEVVILATVTNRDTKDATYTVNVFENTAWSDLISIEPKTITVPAGQSEDVTIRLNIDPTAEGDKEFTIRVNYGADQTAQEKVVLTITKSAGADFGSIGKHLKNNWFIYVIIIINVILIIAIIMVIRRMMRPRARSA